MNPQPLPHKISSRPRSRGAVLLLVLCAVAILTVLAVEVASRARLDVQRGQRTANDLVFKRSFESGIETARGLLWESRKNSAFDYWGDGWNKPMKVESPEGSKIRIQVFDESGKLNLQKLMRQTDAADSSARTFARLFEYLRKHDALRSDQWKDAETLVRGRLGFSSGNDKPQESSKVNTQQRNAPLLTLDGLREAGLSADQVFGTPLGSDEKSEIALCDVFTTFGDGLINLNTAHESVLYALDVEYDDKLVDSITNWRGRATDDGSGAYKAFREPKDLERVEGIVQKSGGNIPSEPDRNLFKKVQNRLTVHSSCFSARIDVAFGQQRKMGWAFFNVSQPILEKLEFENIKLIAFEEIEP